MTDFVNSLLQRKLLLPTVPITLYFFTRSTIFFKNTTITYTYSYYTKGFFTVTYHHREFYDTIDLWSMISTSFRSYSRSLLVTFISFSVLNKQQTKPAKRTALFLFEKARKIKICV